MTHESSSKKGDAADADDASERPTINPPFDVEAFARAATSPRPELPTTRPPPPPYVDPPSGPIAMANQAVSDPHPTGTRPPMARSPSALWMADALAPSAPPPRDSADEPPPGVEAVTGAAASTPAPEISERTIEDPLGEMRERASLGDYTGALEMAELILAQDEGNIEAAECVESCRSVLENMYSARLGPLDRVPIVIVPRAQMRWLSIDHRAGFVLSLIDGSSTVEMILDVSGMPKLDALRILHELVQQRIVALKS